MKELNVNLMESKEKYWSFIYLILHNGNNVKSGLCRTGNLYVICQLLNMFVVQVQQMHYIMLNM